MAATRRWIRLDAEWEESGWINELSGQARGCWPRLLCWVKLRGSKGRCKWPDAGALSRLWRVPQAAVETMFRSALLDGAVTRDGDELVVAKWTTYQEPDVTALDRKRRQRARLSASISRTSEIVTPSHADVTDVTRDTGVTRHATTNKEKNPSGSKRGRARGEGAECPPDWHPHDAHRQKAQLLGLELDREAEKFRNYHASKGSRFRDWGRAFHTWLDRADEFRQPASRPPPASNGAQSAKQQGFSPEVLDDLLGPREESDW
jgi:hypothetical protein